MTDGTAKQFSNNIVWQTQDVVQHEQCKHFVKDQDDHEAWSNLDVQVKHCHDEVLSGLLSNGAPASQCLDNYAVDAGLDYVTRL